MAATFGNTLNTIRSASSRTAVELNTPVFKTAYQLFLFFYSEDLNVSHMVIHITFGKQTFRELRKDLMTNILTFAGKYFKIRTKLFCLGFVHNNVFSNKSVHFFCS